MDISKFLTYIMSMTWMAHPQHAINYGTFLKGLMEGSLVFDKEKDPIGATIVTPTNRHVKLFSSEYDTEDKIKQDSIFDHYPEGSVLILPLKGVMLKEDTWWSWGTESISKLLREAADHSSIAAAIIEVDSGGGSVDSVHPMTDQLLYARGKMPVIGLADMAASAAYYTISATDLIIASNDISSEFGSIGVMMSFADLQPYWESMGVKFHTIYAPESTHKNLPFELALKGNYDLMKSEVLSPIAKKFQNDVRKFRGGKVDITQKGILNGKMYYATDAIKYGLADELGNLDYAIEKAISMAKLNKYSNNQN